MHFQNLEVRCDWSTRLAARFSRRSLGRKDCVTSQKNVCVGGYGRGYFCTPQVNIIYGIGVLCYNEAKNVSGENVTLSCVAIADPAVSESG